ncbi:MAG: ABC transporter permease, partial [Myxococcales bacterium]|nr:ABC transporter permease [Myxococcales bacterium]
MNALIWRIALRNVLAHRVKSVIVGVIFALGALVGVVGNALVDAMDRGMSRSIIESLAGHLQIHARGGKDPFSIYGDEFAGMPDFGVIPDFAAVKRVIGAVPGVEAVIPMGSQVAFGDGGNLLDRKLAALRAAVKAGDAAATADLVAHVRSILALVVDDLAAARGLTTDAEVQGRLRDAELARADAFWADFDAAPLAKLEHLENRVAPLLAQPGTLPIWFLGTDLDQFRARFPRFKVVLGQAVPPQTRGFLFNHGVYEEAVKDRAAWAFDKLTKAA